VLCLLFVEGTVGGLALKLENFREPLVWTVIGSIPAFLFTVVGLAIWRPEALRGGRPLEEAHANQFASDLYVAFDGPLRNMEAVERAEAWLTLADIITSGNKGDESYSTFCSAISTKLKDLTNLTSRTLRTRGPVK
jgi:hypothetical protein